MQRRQSPRLANEQGGELILGELEGMFHNVSKLWGYSHKHVPGGCLGRDVEFPRRGAGLSIEEQAPLEQRC